MPKIYQRDKDVPAEISAMMPPRAVRRWRQRYNRVVIATEGCVECAEREAFAAIEKRGYEVNAQGIYKETARVCKGCGD